MAAKPLGSASTPCWGVKKSPATHPAVFAVGSGLQLCPPLLVKNTPEGNMADAQPMAQPCRRSKNRICFKAGSSSRGRSVQRRPPSSVVSTTPVLVCVYGWENPPAAQPVFSSRKKTDSSRQPTPDSCNCQPWPPSPVCQIVPRSPTAQPCWRSTNITSDNRASARISSEAIGSDTGRPASTGSNPGGAPSDGRAHAVVASTTPTHRPHAATRP